MDENNKFSFKNIFVPVVTLLIICCVTTALLALTNAVTKEPIAKNNAEKADALRYSVFPEASGFEKQDGYYTAVKNSEIIGYIFETSAKGYGGDIEVLTGITADGAVAGVEIMSHGETPGLGANCTNESFKGQFKESAPKSNGYSVTKGNANYQNGEIDAITGATISSKAVTSAVNEALEEYAKIR